MAAALLAARAAAVASEREDRRQRLLETLRTIWALHMTSWMLLADARTDTYLKHFGGDTTASAALQARGMVFMLVSNLALAPFFAKLSEKYGRRALLLLSPLYSLLLRAIELLSPRARTLFLTNALAAPVNMGPLGVSICVADLCVGDPSRTGMEMARISTGTYVAAVLGPAVGAALTAVGVRWPVALSALLSLLQGWLVLRHMPETSPAFLARNRRRLQAQAGEAEGPAQVAPEIPRQGGLLWRITPGLGALLVAQLLAFVSEPILVSRIGSLVLTESLGWGTAARGRYAALEALCSIPGMFASGHAQKRLGTAPTLMLGSVAALAQHLLCGWWVKESWQQCLMPLVAMLRGLGVAPLGALLQRAVEDAGIPQAEFNGLRSALQSFAALVATILWSRWFSHCVHIGKPRRFHLGPAAVAGAELALGCVALRLSGAA